MPEELSYTIEEVAKLLKVSKLTIYDLVKKGDLPVFRVGRQMRVHADDLNQYINSTREAPSAPKPEPPRLLKKDSNIVISGQDLVLDILGKHIEKQSSYKPLRSYTGSLNSLVAMYNGDCDIVSLHLFDGETGEYNLPYLKKILAGYPYILLNVVTRKAGMYVQNGNPHQLSSWPDLEKHDIRIINREKGSGARILLDEQLSIHGISSEALKGYQNEETSHLSVASAVFAGKADAGIGIEKAAKIVGVDFIPLITEQYDIVILKTTENRELIDLVKGILSSKTFQSEIDSFGGYDTSSMGETIYETF
ncbi:helix-turn-helix transcriptional regulator [Metabacillus sp. GX 13764]|uniref:helix-turn-helix transcriptional regulator n=1 Tax=Metabacillus kandeliae TaxID=2900151 RepID=UPI001E5FEE7C|nr:helix-turn-helix transcriptional regulator [Metabacillus kandeliae]MCD7035680.1 helix-turn-helix transcriptional regulator [Metabacillus kandeliae]